MDSRFGGNDVMIEREPSLPPYRPLPRKRESINAVARATRYDYVIPAQAGIHRLIQGVMNPETRETIEGHDTYEPCPVVGPEEIGSRARTSLPRSFVNNTG